MAKQSVAVQREEGRLLPLDGSARGANIAQEQSAYIHDGVRNIPRLA
jgi:hypothetical protein